MKWLKAISQKVWDKLGPIWHRWQFGRLLIILFLTLFLVTSAYLAILAKTAHVKNLKQRSLKRQQFTMIRVKKQANYIHKRHLCLV